MRNRKHTRGLSLLLCAALLAGQLGTAAFAAELPESTGGLCEHHPEHIDCGYVEGDEAHPCGYICEICTQEKDSGNMEEQTAPNKENSPSVTTVAGFDELDAGVRFQTIAPGTALDKLNLPAVLDATGYTVADDTQPVPEPITIENVAWEPDTAYNDTAEQGGWLFTPVLPDGYVCAADVELPEISVRIEAPIAALTSDPADANSDGYHDGDVAAINAMIATNDLPLTKDAPASWATEGVTWDESTPKRITYLKLSEKGLTGEMDVSALTAMTGLRCEKNKLTALTLSNQLTNLVYLDCSYNGLTALDVSGVTELSYLDCSVNRLTELDVSSVTDLDTLGCANNRLTALDVSSLVNLVVLECSNNKLTALDVSKLTKMKDLHCAFNDLESLPGLSDLTNLTNLMCAYNPRLSSLEGLGSLTKLRNIDCGNTALTDLPGLDNLTSLKGLHVDNTGLTALDVSKLTKLEQLSVEYTLGLTTLDLTGLTALKVLDIKGVPLTSFTNPEGTTLTIQSSGGGTVYGFELRFQAPSYDFKTKTLSLFARPEQGTVFDSWEGVTSSDQNTAMVTLSGGATTVKANFKEDNADAALYSLSVPGVGLMPDFDPEVTSYARGVGKNTSSITIEAVANNKNATVSGAGTKELQYGENKFTITVTAADGTTKKEYTVTITREKQNDNPLLGSLTVTGATIAPEFSPTCLEYDASVGYDVTSVTISAQPRNVNTTVTGTGTKELKVGVSTFQIITTSEDGKHRLTYKITITRAASDADATLSSLTVPGISLSPTFAPVTTSYTGTVDHGTDSITINAQANDPDAAVAGTGTKSLIEGENQFTITVTAKDGSTTQEYTVVIFRAAENADATLSGLSVPGVTLNPSFAPETTGYAGSVSADTKSITIQAQANDKNATVTGTGTMYLGVGTKTYTVTVTAADGATTKDYTITITRAAESGGGSTGGGGSSGGGGGSGSGGSSGGGATVVTPPSTADKPNPPVTAESKVTAKVDGTGSASVSVPEKSVTDAIKAAQDAAKKAGITENGIAITINVETSKAADSIAATLPQNAMDALVKAGAAELKIESKTADITLDLATMKQIQAAGSGNVTVSAAKVEVSELSQAAQAAIGSRPVFALSIQNGGKAVTTFGGGSVTVALPYTLQAGEKAGNLYGVYVDDAGKVTYLTNSSYDANTKTLLFATDHFSTFGIGYKADTPAFTDTAGHWAKDDIDFVVSRGLLNGTGATTFSPNTGMTRGMFVTALGRLAGIDATAYKTGTFTDVSADSYYAPYVNWAASKGVVSGTTATTFSPDSLVTRQQMATIMANYAKAMGYTVPKTREAVTFADNANIASWAKDAVKAMQMAGILMGKDGNRFDPTGTATRAEAAALFHRYVELVIDQNTTQGWAQNDAGNRMYYENNKPVTGWKQIGDKWYYFNTDGAMATDTEIDGYKIGPDGVRQAKK